MKKVLLFSFFNSNNLGDRVLSDILYRELSRKHSVVRCSYEGEFTIRNRYQQQPLSLGERLRHKICVWLKLPYMSPRDRRFVKKYGKRLPEVSAVVFGGGNLLMDYSKRSSSYEKLQRYICLAHKEHKDCYAISIGIGPFAAEWQLQGAVDALNLCKYISFRDATSYDLFVRGGGKKEIAHIGMDPAFTLDAPTSENVKKDAIAINVLKADWYGAEYREQTLRAYAALVREVAYKYPEKHIMLFATETNDGAGVDWVYRSVCGMPNVSVAKVETLEDLKELYRRSVFVIGARMHSLIIAFSCSVPVIGLVWTDKVRNFFSIIGKPHMYVLLSELNDHIAQVMEMAENTQSAWDFHSVKEAARRAVERDLEEIG